MDHERFDIRIDSLRKRYGGRFRRKGVQALDDVSMNIRRGEIFALLGPNGAGKTTLIKVLLGIIRSNGGTAEILGLPAGDRRSRVRIGYLPEHLRIPNHHTARTALDFYGKLSGLDSATIRARSEPLIEKVGLKGRDREPVKRFSKGMLQRLGLAQALLHQPQLLIMDEPTDGLDPVGRSQIRAILQELRDEGRTVFLNSHLLQEVELICDRVAIMNRGQLRFVGAIDQLQPQGAGLLELRLEGDRDVISAIVNDAVLTEWGAATVGRKRNQHEADKEADSSNAKNLSRAIFTTKVAVESPQASDQLVDQLRNAGVGIRELKWQGATLEDAFLKLVGSGVTTDSMSELIPKERSS